MGTDSRKLIMTQAARTYVELSPENRAQIKHWQEQIKAELPELANRLRLATKAAEDNTFSGGLRRAIHASGLTLNYLADRVGSTPIALDTFLTGEDSLQSDVIDRLMPLVGYKLMGMDEPSSDAQTP